MLFDRYVSVQIGEPGKQGVEITDLRITFDVKKSTSKSANTAEIEIYNLSKDTLSKIVKINNVVILSAGYREEGILGTIFTGNLTRVNTQKNGADKVTKIECLDGIMALRERTIALSYKEGTPVMTALDAIVKELGLPLAQNIVIAGTFPHGYQFAGSAKDALTRVCDRIDKEWSVQDGQIQIIDQAGINERRVVVLSYDTGLIEIEDLRDVKNDMKPTQKGRYKVKALLTPYLIPGGKVKIESEKYTGVARVETLEYTGDTHGDDWFSVSEVTAA